MKWQIVISIVVLFFLGFPPQKIFAIAQSITFNGYVPTQVVVGQPFEVPVKFSCSSCEGSYIRIVLYQTGHDTSAGYFGETKNNLGLWKNRDASKNEFYRVLSTDLISDVWTATMSAQADTLGSYSGSGDNYEIKIIRYTDGGNVGAESAGMPISILGPTPTPTPPPSVTPNPTATPTPTPKPQPGNISLSELMACSPGGGEWVEIYNGNNGSEVLSNWKLQDNKNTSMTITDTTIDAKGYKAFDISGFNYNDDGDTVRLLDGNGNLVESFSYTVCYSTQSHAKTSTGSWQTTSIITKGAANKFPTPVPSPTVTPTPKPTATPSPDPTVLGESTESAIPTFVVSDETAEGLATRSASKKAESPVFAIIAIVLGIISLLSLGGYLWYDWKKKQSVPDVSQ